MNRKMLSGFWDAAPIFNQVGGGQALGLNRTFSSIFLESQACSAPWNVLFVLCWVCACGSRKDHSADADSSVSAFSPEVQLLSGAYILSVCSILKITLLGTVSLPQQWTEKEQHVWAGLDNAWVAAARNNFPATLRASWVLVHVHGWPWHHVHGWPACHICWTVARMQIETQPVVASLASLPDSTLHSKGPCTNKHGHPASKFTSHSHPPPKATLRPRGA